MVTAGDDEEVLAVRRNDDLTDEVGVEMEGDFVAVFKYVINSGGKVFLSFEIFGL